MRGHETTIKFTEEGVILGISVSFCLCVCVCVSHITPSLLFCSANQQPTTPLPVFRGTAQEAAGAEDVHVNSPGMQ